MSTSSDWTRYVDENSGYPYWFNSISGESRWASEQEAAVLYQTNSPIKPVNNAPERRPEAFIYPGIHSPGGGFSDQFVPHKERGMPLYGQKPTTQVDIRQDSAANEASDEDESEYESNSDENEDEEDEEEEEDDDEEEGEEDDDDDEDEDDEYEEENDDEDGSDNDSSDIEASPIIDTHANKNKTSLPPKMETAFQHYIQTSDGKKALETEQSRVEQAMELKEMKEHRLMVRKQQYDARPKKGKKPKRTFAMAANAVLTAAWTPMTLVLAPIGSLWNSIQSASSSSSSSSNKNKKKRGKGPSSSSSSSHGNTNKHENNNNSGESVDLEGGTSMDEEELRPPSASGGGAGMDHTLQRRGKILDHQSSSPPPPNEPPAKQFTHTKHPSNYRHDLIAKDEVPDIEGGGNVSSDEEGGSSDDDSDGDSDSDSVSSNDSDVRTVQSPLLPAWLSLSALSNNVTTLYNRAKGIITTTTAATNQPSQSTSLTINESALGLPLTTSTQDTSPSPSTRLWDKVTTTSVETMQWALLQTGAGVAVVAGSIWNRINNALQRYVNETIDNNTGGGRGRPPSRELAIAPSTTRDAMAP